VWWRRAGWVRREEKIGEEDDGWGRKTIICNLGQITADCNLATSIKDVMGVFISTLLSHHLSKRYTRKVVETHL
jgi:hypothetical protein